eukprot:s563_g20.t1
MAVQRLGRQFRKKLVLSACFHPRPHQTGISMHFDNSDARCCYVQASCGRACNVASEITSNRHFDNGELRTRSVDLPMPLTLKA